MTSDACGRCGVQNVPLKRCGECKSTVYCSVDCQKNDWKKHKRVCKKDRIVFISGKVEDKSGNKHDFGHEFPVTRAQLELFKADRTAGAAFVNDKIITVIEPDVLPKKPWVCGMKKEWAPACFDDDSGPSCHEPVHHIVMGCGYNFWPKNGSDKIMNAAVLVAIPSCSHHKEYHTKFMETIGMALSYEVAELQAQTH